MKLSELLNRRQSLLRETHLANLAFAYQRLGEFADRIARGKLHGTVNLKRAEPESGRAWPVLTALEGNQSVIEEHFSEEDIIDMVDVTEYALQAKEPEVVFELGEFRAVFQRPLRLVLEEAGVQVDDHLCLPPYDVSRGDLHRSACDEDDEL